MIQHADFAHRTPQAIALSLLLALPFALFAPALSAATLRVGPGQPITRIAEAAFLARDGDVVEILPGEYRGDVAIWGQKRLTIRGVGKRPVLVANGRSAENKAIWVIRNGEFQIDNIEFRGARVIHDNGAGIRFERGKLTIRNCRFVDNQNGILTGNQADTELTILDSHFSDAPRQPGALTHLLYAGRIARLVVQGSRFENGFEGHLIKSRARRSEIRYNWIVDGDKGEASYEIDLPDGGTGVIVGNVIGQSRSSQNPVLVAFGAEGRFWANNSLLLGHNTMISARNETSAFLRVWNGILGSGVDVVVVNNVLIGGGEFRAGEGARIFANHAAAASDFDATYAPAQSSGVRKAVAQPLPNGLADEGRPSYEFVAPTGRRALAAKTRGAALIPGAFQPRQ